MKILVVKPNSKSIHIVPETENERQILSWFAARKNNCEIRFELIGRRPEEEPSLSHLDETSIAQELASWKTRPFINMELGETFAVDASE